MLGFGGHLPRYLMPSKPNYANELDVIVWRFTSYSLGPNTKSPWENVGFQQVDELGKGM